MIVFKLRKNVWSVEVVPDEPPEEPYRDDPEIEQLCLQIIELAKRRKERRIQK